MFLVVKFSIYLNRRVFVMWANNSAIYLSRMLVSCRADNGLIYI